MAPGGKDELLIMRARDPKTPTVVTNFGDDFYWKTCVDAVELYIYIYLDIYISIYQ